MLVHKRKIERKIVLPTTQLTSATGAGGGSQISMVLGQYEYNNEAFKGSKEKV